MWVGDQKQSEVRFGGAFKKSDSQCACVSVLYVAMYKVEYTMMHICMLAVESEA